MKRLFCVCQKKRKQKTKRRAFFFTATCHLYRMIRIPATFCCCCCKLGRDICRGTVAAGQSKRWFRTQPGTRSPGHSHSTCTFYLSSNNVANNVPRTIKLLSLLTTSTPTPYDRYTHHYYTFTMKYYIPGYLPWWWYYINTRYSTIAFYVLRSTVYKMGMFAVSWP